MAVSYRALNPASLMAWGRSIRRLHAIGAICRWNLRSLCRHWLFWVIVGLGMLHFLLQFALIYTKAQIDVEQPALKGFLANFLVTGEGTAYRNFLAIQSRAVMLLLAFAGVASLIGDFRAGGIVYYLARPIDKLEYVAGKCLAFTLAAGLLTLAPALVLYLEFGFFSNSLDYWRENPRIAFGIVAYSALIAGVHGILAVALGIWCRRATPFVMAWTSIFVLFPIVGELLGGVFRRVALFRLLNLWLDLRTIGDRAFGKTQYRSPMPNVGWATVVVVGVVVASLFVISRKLRAIEIVE